MKNFVLCSILDIQLHFASSDLQFSSVSYSLYVLIEPSSCHWMRTCVGGSLNSLLFGRHGYALLNEFEVLFFYVLVIIHFIRFLYVECVNKAKHIMKCMS